MKQIIREEVCVKNFEGEYYNVRFSDLPKDIQENDIINIIRQEYSESNFWDAFTKLIITRERLETEEEYQKRIAKNKELRKGRYETYLKLKAEFESL